MYSDIKIIFREIINKITITNNIYRYLKAPNSDQYQQYNFYYLYFNTISEIWIIYLIYLYEIYSEKIEVIDQETLDNQYILNTLEFVIPKKFIKQTDGWESYDPKKFSEKKESMEIGSEFNNTNQLIMNIYFNFNEIINISKKIEQDDFVALIKNTYKINFDYCNFITAFDEKINLSDLQMNNNTNLKIYSKIQINVDFGTSMFTNDINQLLILYNKINHYIDNMYITSSIRDVYKINMNTLKSNNKKNILNNIDILHKDMLNSIAGKFSMALLILILTDNKLLLISNNFHDISDPDYILKYSLLRNFQGKIYYGNYESKINDILAYLCNNDDNIDKKIEKTLSIITDPIDKIKWIKKLDFIIPEQDIINGSFLYQKKKYLSLTCSDTENNNNITLLLYRFGFDFRDIDEYIFLYPNIQETFSISDELYNIQPNNEKCFILINKYKKCIEITFKNNPNNSIDINQCFIFDETNKNNKNKLLFNLSKETHPFISIIPENSPYLCYEKDNHFYLEFILSPTISKNSIGNPSQIYRKEKTVNFEFSMYTLKIAPSYIFPTINTYNSYYHNLLFDFFEKEKLTLTFKNDIIKQKCSIEYDVKKLNDIIDNLYITICDTISCNTPVNMDNFKDILIKIDYQARKKIIDSFYSEHRIATHLTCEEGCIDDIYKYIPILNVIKSKLLLEITLEKKRDDFIVNNIHIWLLVMEINILINLLNHFKINIENGKLKSGDIQDKLTVLQSIKYFNHLIKNNFYYGIELLFLLQNEYFFKESQMIKYDEIRKDLNLDDTLSSPNGTLKLHQFMMGKGKTSVFTPLLSFIIKLLKDKQPTIITMEHLIKPTRKYTIFIENIMNIKVNILSDFQAKKRWLEHTDKNLLIHIKEEAKDLKEQIQHIDDIKLKNEMKERIDEILNTDLNNEMNLIDEFDSHHNYLQSMFNVIDNNIGISEDLFTYIFNFTFNNLKDIENTKYQRKQTPNELIENADLLDSNLHLFFNQSQIMTYNKDYGFAYTIDKDLYYIPRICTPFARKDTPVKNSKFSSLLLTLILTFKEYIYKYDCCLNHDTLYDYNNFLSNKQLIKEIIDISNLDHEQKLSFYHILSEGDLTLKIIENILESIYTITTIEIKNKILVKYLYSVNSTEITITRRQYNMSFQDIIYNNYHQWQVGYTGTASLNLNCYKSDEINVFREIKNDPDEIIEIKLALDGYAYSGGSEYNKNVILINNQNKYTDNITIIVKLLQDNPRGFVDLAGIFLDIENIDIAKDIKLKLNKKIVYFEDDHEAYEYNNIDKIKYIESHTDNFYYYDQCHTVGSDLKQPFDGHVAIIINRNTRYTDFAQAVFRFRKLNRGTYLSVIFVKDDQEQPKTNDEIYLLLIKNEDKFNKEQKYGLKYQLLKTMIRKETNDYLEIDLKPEFMRSSGFNKQTIIEYMQNNIKSSLSFETYLETNSFIKGIHDEIIEGLNPSKLIKLIVGSGNEVQKQQQQQQQQQQQEQEQQEEEQEQQRINYSNLESKLENFSIHGKCYIEHLNCSYCYQLNSIKLFNSLDIKINNKYIYISYNILTQNQAYPKYQNFEQIATYQFTDHKRFYYIEFNDIVLIEIESVALDYYLNKLPVYNHEGILLVPHMYNSLNNPNNLNILDIDIQFIKMLGIKNYINPNYHELREFDMQTVVNDLNPFAFILLSYHIFVNPYKYRYNLSIELQNRINNFKILDEPSPDFEITFDSRTHNSIPNNNLTNVYFNIYKSELTLNREGYYNEPNRIYYRFVYNHNKNDLIYRISLSYKFIQYKLISDNFGGGSTFIGKAQVIDGIFYKKYLKYKLKYLHLKNNL